MLPAIHFTCGLIVQMLVISVVTVFAIACNEKPGKVAPLPAAVADSTWEAPHFDSGGIINGAAGALIVYGRQLIAHTSKYLGPKGTVAQMSNGMNCQNCHLDAGTRPWGNNYGAVYATYPKFRDRSGTVENIYKRVNDCLQRSLNGQVLDTGSREMQAIYAYLTWLGSEVPKGKKPYGSGLEKLAYLNRAASPEKGKSVYTGKCQTCHGANGEGLLLTDSSGYTFPPLWGPQSYNDGAGLFRLSNFASFSRNNMPFGQASHQKPVLSAEEAWDVAAFVNSQPRPHGNQSKDWPDISKKPIDYPFGPYSDTFSQTQHKYGPFKPIAAARDSIARAHTTAMALKKE